MGEQRPNIDGSLVPALSHVPGVAAAEGSAFGYTRLIGKDGKPIGNPGNGAPTLGGNWSTVPALNPFHLVAGHAPQAPDEVVIDKQSARLGHLAVGDTTTVIANGPPQQVRIAGIAGFGTADNLAGASVVLFTTPVAQRLVAEPGKFSTIGFVADRGVSQQQLVSNLKRALPPGTEALTGAAAIKEQQDQFQKALSIFSKFFLIFAIVALVVGAYIILNTFAITVAQRTRENGLLRALGASRRQVLASVLIEALAVGVIAALLGLAAGVAVAAGLKALLSAFGLSLPGGSLVLNARTVVASLVIGIGVTLIAAISPARKAAKVPPVAAMQEATVGSTGYGSKQRIVVGLSILALGVAALFTGLFGHVGSAFADRRRRRAAGLPRRVGAGPDDRAAAEPGDRRSAAPHQGRDRHPGPGEHHAQPQAHRGQRVRADDRGRPDRVHLDLRLLGQGVDQRDRRPVIRRGLRDQLRRRGVGRWRRPRAGPAAEHAPAGGRGHRGTHRVHADPRPADHDRGGRSPHGRPDLQRQPGAGVDRRPRRGRHRGLLRRRHQAPPHARQPRVRRVPRHRRQTLRVALIYGDNQAAPSANPGSKTSYFLGTPGYDANFAAPHFDTQVFVKKAPGATTAAALAAVKTVAAQYAPGTTVQDQAAYKTEQTKPINQILALIYTLLALAIVIALLGIGNTLALSIFERTRELGVMRAVG